MIPKVLSIPSISLTAVTDSRYYLKRFMNPARTTEAFEALVRQNAQNEPLTVDGTLVTSFSKKAYDNEERLYYGIFEFDGVREKLLGQIGFKTVAFGYEGVDSQTYRPVFSRFNGVKGSLLASREGAADLLNKGIAVVAHEVVLSIIKKNWGVSNWALCVDTNSAAGVALGRKMGLTNSVNIVRIDGRVVPRTCLLSGKISRSLVHIARNRKPAPTPEQMKSLGRDRA